MVSLIVGMMLNVPVRAAEYLAAMPPIPPPRRTGCPCLHFAMTARRRGVHQLVHDRFRCSSAPRPSVSAPALAIWLGDLSMQLVTAQMVASTHLPANVAAALQSLLTGNVKKVLISMALWLPYLLLSTRVNVTYRHRVPA